MISIITDNRIPERPRKSVAELEDVVRAVLDDVKKRGDEALKEYEEKFDKVRLSQLAVTPEEMDEAERQVDASLKLGRAVLNLGTSRRLMPCSATWSATATS